MNTRDNPELIEQDVCQNLVNCSPGHPAPLPRNGIEKFTNVALPDSVRKLIPWDDLDQNKVIILINGTLYWTVENGLINVLKNNVFTDYHVRLVRIKNYGLLIGNVPGESYRIWWNTYSFSIENANIKNDNVSGLSAYAVDGLGNANVIGVGKTRGYSFTFVCRDDSNGIDFYLDPILPTIFHPGVAETNFDPAFYYEHLSITGNGPGIYFNYAGTLDPQVTHLRIYCTQDATDQRVVSGLTKHWLVDLPVKGPNAITHNGSLVYIDNATIEDVVASLNTLQMIGYSPIPASTYQSYFKGRLWVCGVGTNEEIGRFYYSELPLDLNSPIKWATVFKPLTNFKDCSNIDLDQAMAVQPCRNNLILFTRRTVWYLRDGDTDYEPEPIDLERGIESPLTIVSRKDDLMYLSVKGPAIIQGTQVQMMKAFYAEEVWPRRWDGKVGNFFYSPFEVRKLFNQAFFKDESYFIHDNVTMIAFYMPDSGEAMGPWRVERGSREILLNASCSFTDGTVILSGIGDAPFLWNFLKAGSHQDNGQPIWLKCRYKARRVDQNNPDRFAEIQLAKIMAKWNDDSPPFYTLITDYARHQIEFQYNQADSFELLPEERNELFRDMIEQPLPDGLIGKTVELEWRKILQMPWEFKASGWIIEVLPFARNGEWLSSDRGDNLVESHPNVSLHLKFDDNDRLVKDFSSFSHDFITGEPITWEQNSVPGGGHSVVSSPNSGYFSLTGWNGLDAFWNPNAAPNTEPTHNGRIIFMPVSIGAGFVVAHAGDGSNFWRIQINTDGSFEFRLKTPTMYRRWYTPAGSVTAGIWHFMMFQLSNYGQNGQFYGGQRDGDFNNYLTTQQDL